MPTDTGTNHGEHGGTTGHDALLGTMAIAAVVLATILIISKIL